MSVPDAVVAAVAKTVSLTEDQIRQVFAALDAVKDGAVVGTVAVDPKTGATAVRVSEGGVPCWLVAGPDGNTHRDMQPTLAGWTVVHEPKADAPAKKKG